MNTKSENSQWVADQVWRTPHDQLFKVISVREDGLATLQMIKPLVGRPVTQRPIPESWELYSSWKAALRNAETFVETCPCQAVVIIRREDEIIIRDNSGVEGLTGEPLMHKTLALLEEIFKP